MAIALTGPLSQFSRADDGPQSIEVFIDSMVHPIGEQANVTVYVIDRIDQLQQTLSKDLPANPDKAKQVALQRFQSMDDRLSQQLENAARGLIKAMQYGIDRYPAIVFDGEAVVYGMTDLHAAIRFYRQWQGGGGFLMQRIFVAACLAITLNLPGVGHSGAITSPQIVAQTTAAALACMRWMPVGTCFWLHCSLSGCSVRTSIKVGHYQPDAVVSSYNELGGNPWAEIRGILGVAQREAANGLLGQLLAVPIGSAGNRTEGTGNSDHRNLIFREVDVVGHPVSSMANIVANLGYNCRSQTQSFTPYFLSGLDALSWRFEIPEMLYPASLMPGLREIGSWPWQTWGGVYPRTGWTTQAEEPKAAAINAQRAGDIVTRSAQPHIYVPITGGSSRGQRLWPPGPLVEGDAATGYWQMLLPRAESSCRVFGSNDLASINGWGGGRVDAGGDYVWNLWRPYSCCRTRGVFLFSTDWVDFPP